MIYYVPQELINFLDYWLFTHIYIRIYRKFIERLYNEFLMIMMLGTLNLCATIADDMDEAYRAAKVNANHTPPELLEDLDAFLVVGEDDYKIDKCWNFRLALDLTVEQKDINAIKRLQSFIVRSNLGMYRFSAGKYRNWSEVEHAIDPSKPLYTVAVCAPWLKLDDNNEEGITERRNTDQLRFW